MDVKIKLDSKGTELALSQMLKDVDQAVFDNLSYEGEKLVTLTRDRSAEDSWIDQTGNLRSSIGYAISKNGVKQSASTFSVIKNGSEGSSKGQEYADELVNQEKGWALLMVAGMEYAEAVEKIEGKNVLADARAKMIEDVPTIARRIKERIEKGK